MNIKATLSIMITTLCMLFPQISNAAKVLEYRFNDPSATRAVDTSGNNLHGAFVGSSIHLEPGRPGHGYAVTLNGVDDFINVGDRPPLDLRRNYTLMGWIKYFGTGERAAELMEKARSYWLNITMETRNPRAGGFFGQCNVPKLRWKQVDGPTAIPDGTWTHLASTYNGRQFRIYVNGRLANTAAVSGAVCVNNERLLVGALFKRITSRKTLSWE
ncbi:MAG: LamG domain-containing protein [Gammaproteobacteria bacterium]|nr:LamG domain-containing protein [Gammaproteobacteria bacterium]